MYRKWLTRSRVSGVWPRSGMTARSSALDRIELSPFWIGFHGSIYRISSSGIVPNRVETWPYNFHDRTVLLSNCWNNNSNNYVCVHVRVCFGIHIERQQAQSINRSKHPLRPTSINININTTIHTLILNIKCFIPPHIDTCMRNLCMCLGYSSTCGAQLIRFSYATNMSRPHESGVRRSKLGSPKRGDIEVKHATVSGI